MKACFPIATDNGINGEIYPHFSSCPLFLIIDTETGTIETIDNCDAKAPLKGCNPFAALRDRELDAIVVDGIGDAAHQTMNMSGFRVLAANSNSLQKLIEALKNQTLEEIEPFYSQDAGRCGDDKEEGSCEHTHPEEEAFSDCVLQGGHGCADHESHSCSHD